MKGKQTRGGKVMQLEELKQFFQNFQVLLEQWNQQAPIVVPLIGIAISFIQVYLFFIPTMIIVTMNTVVFGPLIGFGVSLIGIVLGTYSFFLLFRNQVGKYLWRWLNRFPMSERVQELMSKVERQGFFYIAMLYGPLILIVSPVPVTIAAGLSNVEQRTYLYGLICGEAMMILMATFLGAGILRVFENPFYLVAAILVIIIITFSVNKLQQQLDKQKQK